MRIARQRKWEEKQLYGRFKRQINNISHLSRELKKTVEYESEGYTSFNCCSWHNHQRIGTKTGGLGNRKTCEDHPKYSIIEIVLNTEKNPGDLWRLILIQTRVKNH